MPDTSLATAGRGVLMRPRRSTRMREQWPIGWTPSGWRTRMSVGTHSAVASQWMLLDNRSRVDRLALAFIFPFSPRSNDIYLPVDDPTTPCSLGPSLWERQPLCVRSRLRVRVPPSPSGATYHHEARLLLGSGRRSSRDDRLDPHRRRWGAQERSEVPQQSTVRTRPCNLP